jgi:exodeoxyribonuclease VII small subunit
MARSNPADKSENAASEPAAPAVTELRFEAALAELEQIVQNMEGGRLPLEESIAAYRRGSELLKHCQVQLSDAESKIQVLDGGTLSDFDATAGGTR